MDDLFPAIKAADKTGSHSSPLFKTQDMPTGKPTGTKNFKI
jgi:hypothetical protein